MKLIGLMPARNEDWVIGLSARVALLWCDEVLILVHASDDGMGRIASGLTREFPDRALVAFENNSEWREMEQRQKLLISSRERGATHVAIIDADEILTGNLLASIRTYIEALTPGFMLYVPGYNLRGSLGRYHANGIWGNRIFSLAFKDDGRANWRGDGFHHREPFNFSNAPYRPLLHGQGGVMHLWGANERRLRSKHALYKMTETLRWPSKPRSEIDTLYSLAVDPTKDRRFDQNWQFAAVPAEWWKPYESLMQYLDADASPWQEKACERLLEEHGGERFAGLDLFGVCEARIEVVK